MIKFLIASVLFTLAAVGCNADGPVAATGTSVVGKVNQQEKLLEETGDVTNKKQSFIVRMGEAEAKRGDSVCLPVEATGFNDIIGFQFTMRFDSAALKFERFQATSLPGYSTTNFGARFAARGYLSTLWTDPSIKGITKPANTKLFEVCFRNLMKKGLEADVKFQDGPTAFEVIQTDMSELRFVYANGKVRSK